MDLDVIEVIVVRWPSGNKALSEAFQDQEYPKPRMNAEKFLL